ncbi:hypothetical protein OG225_41435 (plasmid) [Nocardia sp. NBC_01377]|uniref:hypothetical protein n=1 Tax=Nocardia sp. NBC_01377 TaxID=2903595 RepID=UPI002F917D79
MTDPAVHAAAALASAATSTAVAAAYPFLGLGAQAAPLLDRAATSALTAVLATAPTEVGSIRLGGCEGVRDGAEPLHLPPAEHRDGWWLVCDPIDGSLNAARGGPRAVSVVAMGPTAPRLNLADEQSIFAIGSHSVDVGAVFETGRWAEVITDHLRGPETTAFLNRDDNRALHYRLGGSPARRIGSRSGYRPSLAGAGWFAVGDATITLPLECALEFGRIGLVEARIQSTIYHSWSGLVVSRDTIYEHPQGLLGYLDQYVAARALGDTDTLRALFTAAELERFAAAGSSIEEVTTPLDRDSFGVGPGAVIAISALSTPNDQRIDFADGLLQDPVWNPATRYLHVDTLVIGPDIYEQTIVPIEVDNTAALLAPLRQWYDTMHWSSPADEPVLRAWSEGRTIDGDNAIGMLAL